MDRFPRNFKLTTGLKRVSPRAGAAAEIDRMEDGPAPTTKTADALGLAPLYMNPFIINMINN